MSQGKPTRRITTERPLNRFFRKLGRIMLAIVLDVLSVGTLFDKSRARYWQAVPFRRLSALLYGVFCFFSATGFLLDLFSWYRFPEWGVLLFSGLIAANAVVFFVIVLRRRFSLLPVFAVLVALAYHLPGWLPRIPQIPLPSAARQRIGFDAFGIMLALMLGRRSYDRFINTEGAEQVRARTELELAHGIQQTLVPPIRHAEKTFEAYGISLPSEDVGGDLVDLIPAGPAWLACITDVSGHGIPAGVLMGNLKTALRLGCAERQPLARMMDAINDVLPAVKGPEMYATFAGLLFTGVGEAEFLIAGHPPILHYRVATNRIERLAMQQFPLGLMAEGRYASASVRCEAGDLFVLVSDGIVEAEDTTGAEFGIEGIERLLNDCGRSPLKEIADVLLAKLEAFGPRVDDQTLLLIRIQ
ncbi:MAG: PP2C family protein-serine/threonine phosphatase [Candidatus Acidiferrales bacterium]